MDNIIPIHTEPSLPRKRLAGECDMQWFEIFETGLEPLRYRQSSHPPLFSRIIFLRPSCAGDTTVMLTNRGFEDR